MDILFHRKSPVQKPGFNDTWLLFQDRHLIAAESCATGPNHRQTWRDGGGYWNNSYGCLAAGHYKYECIDHDKFHRCLLINDGGRVPSCVPNPRHDGELWLAELFVHCAQSKTWRGSAGCITMDPDVYPGFIAHFKPGDKGQLELVEFGLNGS